MSATKPKWGVDVKGAQHALSFDQPHLGRFLDASQLRGRPVVLDLSSVSYAPGVGHDFEYRLSLYMMPIGEKARYYWSVGMARVEMMAHGAKLSRPTVAPGVPVEQSVGVEDESQSSLKAGVKKVAESEFAASERHLSKNSRSFRGEERPLSTTLRGGRLVTWTVRQLTAERELAPGTIPDNVLSVRCEWPESALVSGELRLNVGRPSFHTGDLEKLPAWKTVPLRFVLYRARKTVRSAFKTAFTQHV